MLTVFWGSLWDFRFSRWIEHSPRMNSFDRRGKINITIFHSVGNWRCGTLEMATFFSVGTGNTPPHRKHRHSQNDFGWTILNPRILPVFPTPNPRMKHRQHQSDFGWPILNPHFASLSPAPKQALNIDTLRVILGDLFWTRILLVFFAPQTIPEWFWWPILNPHFASLSTTPNPALNIDALRVILGDLFWTCILPVSPPPQTCSKILAFTLSLHQLTLQYNKHRHHQNSFGSKRSQRKEWRCFPTVFPQKGIPKYIRAGCS